MNFNKPSTANISIKPEMGSCWIDFLDIKKYPAPIYPSVENIPQIFTIQAQKAWIEKLKDKNNQKMIQSMTQENSYRLIYLLVFEELSGAGIPMIDKQFVSNIAKNRLSLSISRLRNSFVNRIDQTNIFRMITPKTTKLGVVRNGHNTTFYTSILADLKKSGPTKIELYELVDLLSKNKFRSLGKIFSMPNLPEGIKFSIDIQSNGLRVLYQINVTNNYLPPSMFVPIPTMELYREAVKKIYREAVGKFPISGFPAYMETRFK